MTVATLDLRVHFIDSGGRRKRVAPGRANRRQLGGRIAQGLPLLRRAKRLAHPGGNRHPARRSYARQFQELDLVEQDL